MKENHISPKKYVSRLTGIMATRRNEENAVPMAKYMKDRYPYYGIKSPERNGILKNYIDENKIPLNWEKTVKLCWKEEEREMQYIGMELAFRSKKTYLIEDIDFFEYIIVTKSWWDTVDFIASNIIGQYFLAFPTQIKPVTTKWNNSSNMWLNRTCLLFQLKYRDNTDYKLLQTFIHRHKNSDEFFIKKAIGWALRQYAKTSPNQVQTFVAETELKALS
jgi:3-methyladenine DNA glycosylase AlkD